MVSDLFFESQTGVLLAPFYLDLFHRIFPAKTDEESAGSEGNAKTRGRKEKHLLLSTHALLSALQETSQHHNDRLPFKALAVMHCLSAAPNRLSSRLSVQPTESLRYQTTTVTFNTEEASTAAAAGAAAAGEENGTEQVLLLGQESFEPHSGFCDKTLNSLRADFVLTAPALTSSSTSDLSTTAAPAGSSSDQEQQQPDYPWLLPNGDVNQQVLDAFCAKVLAVLSDKPGAGLRTLHTALVVLSAPHTEALLRLMVERGLVRTRLTSGRCTSNGSNGGTAGKDLFGLGAAVFPHASSSSARTNATAAVAAGPTQEQVCYFAANLIGLQ